MAKDETKKRLSLYFNLDDPDEKLMFDHLNKRKKSQYIKNLIMNDIKGNNISYVQAIGQLQSEQPKETDNLNDCDLDAKEMDFD